MKPVAVTVLRVFRVRWSYYIERAFESIRYDGLFAFLKLVETRLSRRLFPKRYTHWIARYDQLDGPAVGRIRADIAAFRSPPLISILLPVARDRDLAAETVRSVLEQLYPHWELCLSLGPSVPEQAPDGLHALTRSDGRIRVTRADGSAGWADQVIAAQAVASGEFVGLIDAGDLLSDQALYWAAREIGKHPDADLLFSDEDTIDSTGARTNPWFKPDWNPALMTSCNAFGRLGIYRRSLLAAAGGLSADFAGAEEYELVLRCARATIPGRIRHISRVLYHRRLKSAGSASPPTGEPGRRAVEAHFAAQGTIADVRLGPHSGYRIRYPSPAPRARVSILVATTARPDIVEPCLTSLLERTRYADYEVLLLVNESTRLLPERAALLARFSRSPKVRIIEYRDRPFNYSEVNNLGAAQASGDLLCFLNDDTEVITPDWLDVLAARLSLPQVAAAGPTLVFPDGTIQHVGVVLGLRGIAGHACLRLPTKSYGYFGRACLEQDVSCVTAACMLIRADVFRQIGGFDELLPLAYNDVDLCLRLRSLGWRMIWTPEAELVHHESASLGRHNRSANAPQYARDVALMRERWADVLEADPCYNRNLSLDQPYALAFSPRPCGDQPSS